MMNDRTNLENYDALKFSRDHGFFEKSIVLRICLGLIFTFALFIFLHFQEVRVDVLELNNVAPHDVVAKVNFDFLDEEATAILKQEAIRDIGKIYQLADNEIRQRRIEFENFLIYNQEWRQSARDTTFEEMYKGVDALEKIMLQLRFTDQRTLQKMQDTNFPSSHYLIYTPADTSKGIRLPNSIWKHIYQEALTTRNFHPATLTFLISFFKNNNWIFQEDTAAASQLRNLIQMTVPDNYTHVNAGNRIINRGEKVTTRHMAMMQAMKNALSANRNLWHPLTLAGSMILALLLVGLCIVYFQSNFPKVLASNRQLSLIITIVILTLIISKLTEIFLLNSTTNAIDVVRYPIFVVFPAILLCSLINPGVATFASGFLSIVLMMTLAFDSQEFVIINLSAALVAILSTRSLRRRKEIFVVCAKAWLCCIAVIFAFNFSHNILWNINIVGDIFSTGMCMLLTAVAVVGMLPLLESSFSIMTDVTLSEYMDPNNDLLRRLTIEAPGTYQHSIVVGNIAETAALAIGANGLFCRVATLYHDIGKMVTPQYFTENQQSGINVHQLLTPQESAEVIIAHVREGVAMAQKADLPEQFIDIIKEHHGTSLVYYFYRKQLELVGGDKHQVDEKAFRYTGPKPRSKESGIIMIADSVEAASRSLEKVDEKALMELATRLVREKNEDGQFEQCLLTLEELSVVTSTLVKTLVAFGHSRVKYPNRDPRKETQYR